MAASDVEPFRLRAAQDAALKFAERVPRQYSVGLVSFSETASLIVPPTTDREALKAGINGLIPVGATAIGDAVLASLEAMRATQPGATRLDASRILLLSDGSNTTGASIDDAVGEAQDLGVPVFTVALGTEDGYLPDGRHVPPDPEALAYIAEETGGQSYESRDAASVSTVYEKLGSFIGTEEVQDEITGWPLGIAAALLLLAGVAAWRLSPRLP
jgi:Ca-activated chloride channel family protein